MSIWVSSLSTSCKEYLSWISIVVTNTSFFSHNVHGSTKKKSTEILESFFISRVHDPHSTAKLPNKINSLKVLSKKLKILDYFEFDEWMQILEMLKNF